MIEKEPEEALDRVRADLPKRKQKKQKSKAKMKKAEKDLSKKSPQKLPPKKNFHQSKQQNQTTPSHAVSRAQGIPASAQRLGKYAVTAKLKFGFGCGFAKRADRQTEKERRGAWQAVGFFALFAPIPLDFCFVFVFF